MTEGKRLTGAEIREIFAKAASDLGMTPEELAQDLDSVRCMSPDGYFPDMHGLNSEDLPTAVGIHVQSCRSCRETFELMNRSTP